jgi:type IV secretory pathway VirD2 relaxase
MSATSRRVTIKMRMVVLPRAGRRSTATHLKYLEREGVTPDGKRGQACGPIHDEVDLKEFERRGEGDRHQFRFIVSAEDGAELRDGVRVSEIYRRIGSTGERTIRAVG